MGDKVTIVGIRKVDFKDKDDKPVNGYSFYFTMEEDSKSLEGVSCGKIFIGTQYYAQMSYIPGVGEECYVFYNKYGKVSSFGALS